MTCYLEKSVLTFFYVDCATTHHGDVWGNFKHIMVLSVGQNARTIQLSLTGKATKYKRNQLFKKQISFRNSYAQLNYWPLLKIPFFFYHLQLSELFFVIRLPFSTLWQNSDESFFTLTINKRNIDLFIFHRTKRSFVSSMFLLVFLFCCFIMVDDEMEK